MQITIYSKIKNRLQHRLFPSRLRGSLKKCPLFQKIAESHIQDTFNRFAASFCLDERLRDDFCSQRFRDFSLACRRVLSTHHLAGSTWKLGIS